MAMEERLVVHGWQGNYISEIRIDEQIYQGWTFFKCSLAGLLSLKHQLTPLHSPLTPFWVSPKHSGKRLTTASFPNIPPCRLPEACRGSLPVLLAHCQHPPHCGLTSSHAPRMEELTGLLESRAVGLEPLGPLGFKASSR